MKIRQTSNRRSFEQESFLVESWSYSGFSGSPVCVFIPERMERPAIMQNYEARLHQKDIQSFDNPGPWLLGINWGHTSDTLKGEEYHHLDPKRFNTGLMCVVPGWKILEILDMDESKEQRKKDEVEFNDPDPSTGAVMDSAEPTERERFENLAKRAFQTPKPETED